MRLLEPAGQVRCSLAAIGDVGLVGTARTRAARDGGASAFAALAPQFAAADLAFANLEFPVGERAWVKPGRSDEFFHDHDVPRWLAAAGVRVVSLANNHMMDCGERGLRATLEACRAAGLVAVGAGETLDAARVPASFEVRGHRVRVLAYGATSQDAAGPATPGIAPLDAALVAADVARWRPETDLLVVSAHWGSMYVDYPPPRVIELARAIADAGADVVLGHHPHVLQGVERRGRTTVLYSLGDAVFNCRAGDFHAQVAAETRLESGVFTVLAADAGAGVEVAPTRLDDDGFPSVPTGPEADAQAARLRELSAGLGDAAKAFAAEAAPRLLQYELQSLGTYLRQGRWDRIVKLLGSVRPRHLPVLWQGMFGRRRKAVKP